MKKMVQRVGLCLLAVSCFWLGAYSAGARFPEAEKLAQSIRTAAEDVLDREKAEIYLQEKLPILRDELWEMKKYFPLGGK